MEPSTKNDAFKGASIAMGSAVGSLDLSKLASAISLSLITPDPSSINKDVVKATSVSLAEKLKGRETPAEPAVKSSNANTM